MAVDRPTFDESWHRVANLAPRLRGIVQVHRQSYRGAVWYVYRDPGNNRFYRMPAPTHGFVGLLDGRRTVAEAWAMVQDRYGDAAPTQGEVVQALGSMYRSNLLHGEAPPDAAGVFARQTERRQREVRGYFQNLLFARIPLFDPEGLLRKMEPMFGWVFGYVGFAVWVVLAVLGLGVVAGNAGQLIDASSGVLSQDNLIYLYLCFAGLKAIHELGHGIACKHFAKRERGGGEVRTLGVMLLVLMPLPYVDATSSWSFRSRWRRMTVAAAGMYVELAAAAIAALIWARTTEGSLAHALSYNVMFVAGVTTILFNANPLIRFDGYYILSDLLDTPNLYQRSQDYLKYLIKKYVYGVRRPRNPAHSRIDRTIFVPYGLASFFYKFFLFGSIFLFVFDKLFFLGAAFAIWGIVGYAVVPFVKWMHYLTTHGELMRTRGRAVGATLAFFVVLFAALGGVPWSDHGRAEGIVEPRRFQRVSLGEGGFVVAAQPCWTAAVPDADDATDPATPPGHEGAGGPVVIARNPELEIERRRLTARGDEFRVAYARAVAQDPGEALMWAEQHDAAGQQLARVEARLAELSVEPEVVGAWLVDAPDRMIGTFQKRGTKLGVIASLDDLVIRLTVDQHLGPRLAAELSRGAPVEIRVPGEPDLTFRGTLESILPTGSNRLPSASLGLAAGGSVITKPDDPDGMTAAERRFEVRVAVEPGSDGVRGASLLPMQRVVARFQLPDRPLLSQGWLALRQLLQRRFQI